MPLNHTLGELLRGCYNIVIRALMCGQISCSCTVTVNKSLLPLHMLVECHVRMVLLSLNVHEFTTFEVFNRLQGDLTQIHR